MKITSTFLLLFLLHFSLNAQKSNQEVAENWLNNNLTNLKLSKNQVFKIRFKRKSLSGETFRFQQNLNGVPVYDSEITIHVNNNSRVSFTENNYNYSVDETINTTPSLGIELAFERAKNEINSKFGVMQTWKLLSLLILEKRI